jgi:hypothetical protein
MILRILYTNGDVLITEGRIIQALDGADPHGGVLFYTNRYGQAQLAVKVRRTWQGRI